MVGKTIYFWICYAHLKSWGLSAPQHSRAGENPPWSSASAHKGLGDTVMGQEDQGVSKRFRGARDRPEVRLSSM